MAPTLGVSTEPTRMPLWLWFIASGTGAVLLGLIALYVVHAPLWVIYVLLPPAMATFSPAPLNPTQQILQALFVFGGAFLLYGMAGWYVGNAIQDLLSWKHSRSRQL
jgi:hypothetical protein